MASMQVNVSYDPYRAHIDWDVFQTYHAVMTCFIVMFSIFGNSLTLAALIKYCHLRRKQNALIASLCVSDLLAGISFVITLPYVMRQETPNYWHPTTTLLVVLVWVSHFHLLAIGVNRFIAVVVPLKYPRIITKRTMVGMIVITWLLPIIGTVPMYLIASYNPNLVAGEIYIRWLHSRVQLYAYLINVSFLIILYGAVLVKMKKQMRSVQAWTVRRESVHSTNKTGNKGRYTRLSLIIIFITVLLDLPYTLVEVVRMLTTTTNILISLFGNIGRECFVATAAVNVLIYSVFSKEFREAYKKMLCCPRSCRKETPSQDATATTCVTHC